MTDLPRFDELVKMAQEDPSALENLRQHHVNALINNADKKHQARLRGLQFQIDVQRQLHTDSAMGSCMKISQMMHESFADLRGWLNQIANLNDPLREFAEQANGSQPKTADILAFPNH